MSDLMDEAIDALRLVSPDQRDEIARKVLQVDGVPANAVYVPDVEGGCRVGRVRGRCGSW